MFPPSKGSPDNWLRVMKEAQSLGLITSATNVFGFGESIEHRIEHMNRIRELQDYSLKNYSNGFTSFIAWPVIRKQQLRKKKTVEEISSN